MKIFAISDLHLSFMNPKPMTKFGPHWNGHPNIIQDEWNRIVGENDLVLVAGDVSWASKLDAALIDLLYVALLNGQKVIIKGNHDYWWQGIKKLRSLLKNSSIYPIRNDSVVIGNVAVIGAKGYGLDIPGGIDMTPRRRAKFEREKNRLRLSIEDAQKKKPKHMIAMLHYPPFQTIEGGESDITTMLSDAGVEACVYGHIHVPEHHERAFQGKLQGVDYSLTSADYLQFMPKLILEV